MAQADSHQPRMDWRSPVFRQCAINKITEAIAGTGMIPSNANTVMMERRIYSRANTREDYLTLTARVIIRIRDMGFDNYGSQSPPREE